MQPFHNKNAAFFLHWLSPNPVLILNFEEFYSPGPIQIQQNLLYSGSSPILVHSNAYLFRRAGLEAPVSNWKIWIFGGLHNRAGRRAAEKSGPTVWIPGRAGGLQKRAAHVNVYPVGPPYCAVRLPALLCRRLARPVVQTVGLPCCAARRPALLYQRWVDIDFLTLDPYPKNFLISISNPYPKIPEIWYPISIGIRMQHWLNMKQTGSGYRSTSGPSFLKTYLSITCTMTLIPDSVQ